MSIKRKATKNCIEMCKMREAVQIKTKSFQTLKMKYGKFNKSKKIFPQAKLQNNQANRVYFKDYIKNCAKKLPTESIVSFNY